MRLWAQIPQTQTFLHSSANKNSAGGRRGWGRRGPEIKRKNLIFSMPTQNLLKNPKIILRSACDELKTIKNEKSSFFCKFYKILLDFARPLRTPTLKVASPSVFYATQTEPHFVDADKVLPQGCQKVKISGKTPQKWTYLDEYIFSKKQSHQKMLNITKDIVFQNYWFSEKKIPNMDSRNNWFIRTPWSIMKRSAWDPYSGSAPSAESDIRPIAFSSRAKSGKMQNIFPVQF